MLLHTAITRPLSSAPTVPSVGDGGYQIVQDRTNKGCFGMQHTSSRCCATCVRMRETAERISTRANENGMNGAAFSQLKAPEQK